VRQGLTPVHFLAQPEPFFSLKTAETTQHVPQKVLVHLTAQPEPFFSLKSTERTQHVPQEVLTSSRKVEECKPLACGDLHLEQIRAWRDKEVAGALGEAVQVDPMESMLKPPGIKRLKLSSDELLSSFAFNFNLRRSTWGCPSATPCGRTSPALTTR